MILIRNTNDRCPENMLMSIVSPVATLLEHFGSNVFYNFHKKRAILKPILQLTIWGCFLSDISWKHTKRTYILTPSHQYLNQSIFWDAKLIWNWQAVLAPDKLSLHYEFMNIHKKGWTVCYLKNFLAFLKIGLFWKFYFSLFSKKGSFKKLKFSWFHQKKEYFFPKNILEKGVKFYMLEEHMRIHFSYKSHHWDCIQGHSHHLFSFCGRYRLSYTGWVAWLSITAN